MFEFVERLVCDFKTRDPFEIASGLGILVLEEPLGSINGYYNEVLDVQFIHVNCDLPDYQKRFVVAHELGHALLHSGFNYHFLKNHTFFNLERFEKEADKFAVLLLVDKIEPYQSIHEVALLYGISENAIKYLNEEGGYYGFSECS